MNYTKEEKFLIDIIKSVLHGEVTPVVDAAIDLNMLLKIARYHRLENFLYYGLPANELGVIAKAVDKSHKTEIYRSAVFAAESELLFNTFEENKIKFMPLKGSIIKHLYPFVDLRTMTDVDIYFEKAKKKQVKKIMVDLGYKVKSFKVGNHDIYLKEPFMNVEMHRDLINECYALSRYYHDINEKLTLVAGYSYYYKMSTEDFYIFLIAHMVKHFSGGGTGIRNVIDVYLYLEKYDQEMDNVYLEKEFAKMGLVTFTHKIKELAYGWFGDLKVNPIIDEIGLYIIHSGVYGNITNAAITEIVLGEKATAAFATSKTKYIFRRLLPKYSVMKNRNQILKKIPVLLPWFWFTRLLTGLTRKEQSINELKVINKIDESDKEKVKKIHEEMGVEKRHEN